MASGSQGQKRPRLAVAQTREIPLLPGHQTGARNQSYSSQFSLKIGQSFALAVVREINSADSSAQCVLEELLVFLLCPKSSVYFETVTKSLLPSRQRCCCVSTKHFPPPVLPLSGRPSLPLPLCDGWEESDFLLQNYPLNPYLSCFWTSLMLHSSSSHMTLLFSKLWLPFLVCEHNPRAQHTAPTAQHQPALWAGRNFSSCSPECTERTLLKVKVSDFISFVNVFSLCSWNHPALKIPNKPTTKTKQNPFTSAISVHYVSPILSLWGFYQDRDQSLS